MISTMFENDNTYPWTIVNNAPNNNTYCLKSGNGGVHNSTSTISIEVEYESNGLINFDGGIYGEGSSDTYNWDKCRFYIDDVLKFDYGAHTRWENFEYEVTPGTHTFKWTYKKDGSVHPTGDAFFIDNICFDTEMFLPITLTSFHAVCTGRSSYIYWTTATETNNEYFILEHSTDAINFQEVTRIPGAGTSIEPNDYEYIDYIATGGDNYYRLIQVDYDGTRTPSEIIYANCMDDHLVHYEEPRAYTDNGIVLVAGDRMCDVYVYTILGTQRYTKRMYPGETGRLNYWGHYIVEFVWVDENTYDIKKKVYKLFNIE